MKTLYLVRHAKSSWQYDDIDDYDRPLKGRGIRDAHMISQWLADEMSAPSMLVSSPATRALHTAMIFARTLNFPFADIKVDDRLYMATSDHLISFLHELSDDLDSVMVFGHNPTITNFVNRCVDQRVDNVPTSGVVCLHFAEEHWKDVQDSAELLYFDYPKKRKKSHS
ncbi:MAG: histidine phosphatase family protein [Bacteroidetes bacterium]|uniref:Histidine phosphatase family protein n=1 Tax=Phaeocystidibacter marisrubri TaxID=1577780 RepID=A0A6L3ZIM7_9FLAO|nr:histidine phosphatase family protein [Phaeocystidibacter marisrubri]KAB2817439.1 histidine phosphatase family protein [Phaeocystidibacter marisrubri]TNE27218.1 MAG: histidine phosphatase family protein [Bacteroidota bacterium]GGH75353.1 phosphohistidine phosphatase SixA [Phaeocystidibacter marisrubri]